MAKKIITETVTKSIKDLLSGYKSRGIGEITAKNLEEKLNTQGINFGRATIGKIIGTIGIDSTRRRFQGKEETYYLLDGWEGNCIHHWVLETPNGPWTNGNCKKCGENEKFSNSGGNASHWDTHKKRKTTGKTFKKDEARFNTAI